LGIIASYIGFDADVPSLEAIAAAVERRTGLRCQLTRDQHGFVVVKCREIYTDIDLRIDGKLVSIEQPISLSVYFFEQLREALVDTALPEINLNQNGAVSRGGSLKHASARLIFSLQMALDEGSQLAASFCSCWILTGRAGTTVEMACLYTIWVTVFFNRTTY